jgi:hypothetical protein
MKECCITSCPSNMAGTNGSAKCVLSGEYRLNVDTGRQEPLSDPDHCSHYAFKMRMGKDRDINATI